MPYDFRHEFQGVFMERLCVFYVHIPLFFVYRPQNHLSARRIVEGLPRAFSVQSGQIRSAK